MINPLATVSHLHVFGSPFIVHGLECAKTYQDDTAVQPHLTYTKKLATVAS